VIYEKDTSRASNENSTTNSAKESCQQWTERAGDSQIYESLPPQEPAFALGVLQGASLKRKRRYSEDKEID
jgi:hypothetical protein